MLGVKQGDNLHPFNIDWQKKIEMIFWQKIYIQIRRYLFHGIIFFCHILVHA
jgi:hypothetical protein